MAGRARSPGRSEHHLSLGPRLLPLFGEVARKYGAPPGMDWRVDDTNARIRGRWQYIYRAIDGLGQIVDAYMSPRYDAVMVCGPATVGV